MIFDKAQKEFPSDFHREVWWWAVGLVPPEVSLTDEVKSQCEKDVREGCYQWYAYFNALCADMYRSAAAYAPATARQYRDMLEHIAAGGSLHGDAVVWLGGDWKKYAEKMDRGKAYTASGLTTADCLNALAREGLLYVAQNDTVVFTNVKYPKIFHAMQVMEHSPNIRKTPARHHFAHCEYRQLFKSYAANYDELLRRVSDESRYIAHEIHAYAQSLKIQRYIHFDTIKYKYKSIRVLDFAVSGHEYPTLRVNIGTCANPEADVPDDGFYRQVAAADRRIQATFHSSLEKCGSPKQNHPHYAMQVEGKPTSVCPYAKIKINPFKDDLDAVLYFIAARKLSIDLWREADE